MQEEFLWYIWKFRLFDNKDLQTVSGEKLQILKPGEHNTDSGPDFFNARIKIGKTLWAGNVEIHVRASDWNKHAHRQDKAYHNIILHVVHQADKKIFRSSGEEIPTLELNNNIPLSIYRKYLQFKASRDWIPCEKQFFSVSRFILNHWIDRLLIERLEKKSKAITGLLKENKNNWEETFYQTFARNFGQKINAEPFELLAKSLPLPMLAKHRNSLLQMEALLFGTAGMLEIPFLNGEKPDAYFLTLQNEYKFLKQKFHLKPLDASLWKFLRLRPSNFPTIRISQFAHLIHQSSHLFSKILEADSVTQIASLLETKTSEYWKTHYWFGKISPEKNKKTGIDFVNTIIINTVIPFLFVYGKEKDEEKFCNRSLGFLESLQPENNSVISKWKSLGVSVKSSYETQALLQLKNEYCSKKKCLECTVGNELLK